VWGWGVAQYPVLLPGTPVTLASAGGTHATFVALIVVAIAAVILVVPSFALLFSLQSRRLLGTGEQGTLSAAAAAGHTGQPRAAHHQRPAPDPHRGPATPGAALGTIVIAMVIRRLRHR